MIIWKHGDVVMCKVQGGIVGTTSALWKELPVPSIPVPIRQRIVESESFNCRAYMAWTEYTAADGKGCFTLMVRRSIITVSAHSQLAEQFNVLQMDIEDLVEDAQPEFGWEAVPAPAQPDLSNEKAYRLSNDGQWELIAHPYMIARSWR